MTCGTRVRARPRGTFRARPASARCATQRVLSRADPFAQDKEKDNAANTKDYVHIRIQQRNGRKSLTTVQVRAAAFTS